MTEISIQKGPAEEFFQDWAEAMDIDIDESNMDEDDKKSFAPLKRKIIKAICNGHLTFNENTEAVYRPHRSSYKELITFKERTGASVMAMDGKGRNKDVAKTYAVMADMTGLTPAIFSGLVGTDIKVCEAIFALLMD